VTTAQDLLLDGFSRVQQTVHEVAKDLTPEQVRFRLDPQPNSIAWLLWHLTRVQDDHVAAVAGTGQVWQVDGWDDRFGLPFDSSATGYGQSPEEVAAVQVTSVDLLTDYHDAVHEQTQDYVRGLADEDLARVVDDSWDPPVTLATRLVSVLSDDLQHVGQAALLRGALRSRS
jgi:uncharacterized damage-inducible protein DinB